MGRDKKPLTKISNSERGGERINDLGAVVMISGPIFMKGLRLSQVLGLNPVLKLRLLSQLSFVLKPYSQKVT